MTFHHSIVGPLCALTLSAATGVAEEPSALAQLERQVAEDLGEARPPVAPPLQPAPLPERQLAEPGYFGMFGDNRTDGGEGVQLLNVLQNGSADQAGLAAGDVVTGLAGQPIRTAEDFAAIAARLTAGSQVEVDYLRSGRPARAMIRLGRRPPPRERAAPEFGQQPMPPAAQDNADPGAAKDAATETGAAETGALHRRIEELEQRVRRLEQIVLELTKE